MNNDFQYDNDEEEATIEEMESVGKTGLLFSFMILLFALGWLVYGWAL